MMRSSVVWIQPLAGSCRSHLHEQLGRPGGQPLAADLLARERCLLEQQHVEPQPAPGGTYRRRTAGARTDHDHVGVAGGVLAQGLSYLCDTRDLVINFTRSRYGPSVATR